MAGRAGERLSSVSNRQQSSVERGIGTPVSQAGVACAPSDRLPFAPSRSDDCSRLDGPGTEGTIVNCGTG